jgi:hypothetical protein
MPVRDGVGDLKYLSCEGDGSVGNPWKIKRSLEGGFKRLKHELTVVGGSYSANDCVACSSPSITTQKIPLAGRVLGGGGAIVRAVMMTDNLSMDTDIGMIIYDGDGPGEFIEDNAEFDDKYADAENIVAELYFSPFAKTAAGVSGSIAKCELNDLYIPYECGSDVMDLYYQLFTLKEASIETGQKFYLNIGVRRN